MHAVFIKRVAPAGSPPYEHQTFAKLLIRDCIDVSDVIVQACIKFPHWRVTADEFELYAVTKVSMTPTRAEMDAALLREPLSPLATLAEAGIILGSCLLASVPHHATAAGGGNPAATLALLELQGASAIGSNVESGILQDLILSVPTPVTVAPNVSGSSAEFIAGLAAMTKAIESLQIEVSAKVDATSAKVDATSAKVDATSAKVDATSAKVDATSAKVDATSAELRTEIEALRRAHESDDCSFVSPTGKQYEAFVDTKIDAWHG
jgi:hypothetical protein